jgi:hypothetical protein
MNIVDGLGGHEKASRIKKLSFVPKSCKGLFEFDKQRIDIFVALQRRSGKNWYTWYND